MRQTAECSPIEITVTHGTRLRCSFSHAIDGFLEGKPPRARQPHIGCLRECLTNNPANAGNLLPTLLEEPRLCRIGIGALAKLLEADAKRREVDTKGG